VLADRTPTYDDIGKLGYVRGALRSNAALPPVHVYARQNIKSDAIQGEHVPAGSLIIIAPWIIHRHRKLWDEPEAFHLRSLRRYDEPKTLSYSISHFCPTYADGVQWLMPIMQSFTQLIKEHDTFCDVYGIVWKMRGTLRAIPQHLSLILESSENQFRPVVTIDTL